MEQRQLVGLITQRSQVRILSPLLLFGRRSSVAEQGTHKPLVTSSNLVAAMHDRAFPMRERLFFVVAECPPGERLAWKLSIAQTVLAGHGSDREIMLEMQRRFDLDGSDE